MGKFAKGDHVKIPIECNGEEEWAWVYVDESDDRMELVFGRLDQELLFGDIALGQYIGVSYSTGVEHKRFS